MPKLILNGKEYANNKPDGYPPIIYSGEEREVGVWTDGKPLYQKSFEIQPSDSSNQVEILHNISNIGKCVKYEGCLNYISGTDNRFLPQMYYNNLDVYSASIYTVNATKIRLVYGEWLKGQASVFKCYVTIYYTKTTDVAGSGKWTTQGTPTHHYSTNEQVIGTWVDGKPVYEKAFSVDIQTDGNVWVDTGVTVSDIKNIIKYDLIGIDRYVGNVPANIPGYVRYYNNNLQVYLNLTWNITFKAIILQYTKTTD